MNNIVKAIESQYIKKKLPDFQIGDTVKVHTKIVEGDKERVQIYNGIVVARKGSGTSETFTVGRVSFGYANEKVFPINSPTIVSVEVLQRGKVRRAKLNYLRGKLGKKAKVSSRMGEKGKIAAFVEGDAEGRDDVLLENETPGETKE